MSEPCRAVWLYGSHSRGDSDAWSDIDVLIVGPPLPSEEIAQLVPNLDAGPLHVSCYSWSEFEAMGRYGSLFLHHLSAEGKALRHDGDAEARMKNLLSALPAYGLAPRDLTAFRTTVRDVKDGLSRGLPPAFELAVLGGVARHASVLACYLAGHPNFGRKGIALAAALLHIPGARRDHEWAHQFRLSEEGQCPMPEVLTELDAFRVTATMTEFLDRLEGLVHANAA